MNLPLHIARRYLFAKKSHNAINIISLISVIGIIVATAAIVCILSVFNGFTDVATRTFSDFDPELRIVPVNGKVFDPTVPHIQRIKDMDAIEIISESLEENAMAKYGERQEPILMKGVTPQFEKLSNLDSIIVDGSFMLREGDTDYGIIGGGLAMLLGTRAGFVDPVELYVPKRDSRYNLANFTSAFSLSEVYISGVFFLGQEKYDNQILIVPIEKMRELLNYENEVTSLDLKVKAGYNINDVKDEISAAIGEEYVVKNRFEQQSEVYRMVNIEKWVTFLIFSIVLTIALFNILGSLSMLIIEKADDVQILKNMGASNSMITRIFLYEGWMITFMGAVAGLVLGLVVCWLQSHYGLIKLGTVPGEFITDAYPVVVEISDLLVVFLAVNVIGFLAVLYPVNNLRKRLLTR